MPAIITGYDGAIVPINQRFFEGGDTFRGFALAGIGPRDIDAPVDQGALGGNVFAIGTLAARLPTFLPESYGVKLGLFTDFGTLGQVDNVIRACTPNTVRPGHLRQGQSRLPRLRRHQLRVEVALRPVQIDLALPYVKTSYDRPQIIHFSTATGF